MLHFGKGLLLYLAVGALAVSAKGAAKPPAQAKPSNNNNNDATESPAPKVEASPKVEESPKVEGTTSVGKPTVPGLSAASSAVSSLFSGATSETPTTTTAGSSSTSSATPTSTGGVDLKRLFGEDERPDIRHLEAVKIGCDAANCDVDVKPSQFSLTEISTSLLALTKLQSEGEWIKSLFDLPGQKGSVTEGPDVVNVTLANLDLDLNLKKDIAKISGKRSIRIEKGNLGILNELGINSKLITEPWWPWALIEGALQLQRGLDNPSFWDDRQIFMLMKIFTGEDTAKNWFNPNLKYQTSDQEISDKIKNADFSPVIYQAVDKPWAVMMRAPYKNADDKDQIGWAEPFTTTEHDHVGEFNSYNLTSEIKFHEIIYFDPPKPFNGRPETLTL